MAYRETSRPETMSMPPSAAVGIRSPFLRCEVGKSHGKRPPVPDWVLVRVLARRSKDDAESRAPRPNASPRAQLLAHALGRERTRFVAGRQGVVPKREVHVDCACGRCGRG